MPEIRTILCPVDFSDTSDHALQYALELAKKFDAKVQAVHVYQLPVYAMPDGAVLPGPELASAITERIHQDLTALRKRYPGVETHLLEGVPHVEINALANKIEASMIVMGTHGRSGLAHMLIGSVAERVVRTSPIPVLTIRGPT